MTLSISNRHYFFLSRKIRGVIQVGAHVGQGLEMFKEVGAKHLLLIEPLKSSYEEMSANCKKAERNFRSIVTVRTALGNAIGKKIMHISRNEKMSSSILKPKKHLDYFPRVVFDSKEKVSMTRLDDLMAEKGLDLKNYNMLFMDTQGYELEVLKGAAKTLKHIDYIFTEISAAEYYEKGVLVGELSGWLNQRNFQISWSRLGKWWSHGNALYTKNPDLLQKIMAVVFIFRRKFRWNLFEKATYFTVRSVLRFALKVRERLEKWS